MKKIIALLLALIMIFSMGTVAFAEGEDVNGDTSSETTPPAEEEGAEEEGTDEDSLLGEYDWILDLPFGTVKPAFKIAKIVLKLAKVYLKLGFVFGFVDKEAFMQQVGDFISGLIGDAEQAPEEAPEASDNVEPGGDVAVDEDLVAA